MEADEGRGWDGGLGGGTWIGWGTLLLAGCLLYVQRLLSKLKRWGVAPRDLRRYLVTVYKNTTEEKFEKMFFVVYAYDSKGHQEN